LLLVSSGGREAEVRSKLGMLITIPFCVFVSRFVTAGTLEVRDVLILH
jgi:hypothetical protein